MAHTIRNMGPAPLRLATNLASPPSQSSYAKSNVGSPDLSSILLRCDNQCSLEYHTIELQSTY